MVAQQSLKYKKLVVDSDKNSSTGIEEANVSAEMTHTNAKSEARKKSEEAPVEAQKSLRAARAKGKHAQQAGIKAGKSSIEDQENLATPQLEVERERQAQIRQVSFVIRLTIDGHDQLPRIEIEYISDSRNQRSTGIVKPGKFVGFDGERLVAYMKECINPANITEPAFPATSPPIRPASPIKAGVPTPESHRPRAGLVVTDVQLFNPMASNSMSLTFAPEEPFVIQAHFQLKGSEVRLLTVQEPSYALKVFANEVTSGGSQLLTTFNDRLIQNNVDYIVRAEMPGLPPGIYRLRTVITLGAPIMIGGFYDKTILQVI